MEQETVEEIQQNGLWKIRLDYDVIALAYYRVDIP